MADSDESSQSVYLFSSGSLQKFPQNSLVDFTNELSMPLSMSSTDRLVVLAFGLHRQFTIESEAHRKIRGGSLPLSVRDLFLMPKRKFDDGVDGLEWHPSPQIVGCDITKRFEPYNSETLYRQLVETCYWNELREDRLTLAHHPGSCTLTSVSRELFVCLVRRELLNEGWLTCQSRPFLDAVQISGSEYSCFVWGGERTLTLSLPPEVTESVKLPHCIVLHLDCAFNACQPTEETRSWCQMVAADHRDIVLKQQLRREDEGSIDYFYYQPRTPWTLHTISGTIRQIRVHFTDEHNALLNLRPGRMSFVQFRLVRNFDAPETGAAAPTAGIMTSERNFMLQCSSANTAEIIDNSFSNFRVRLNEPLPLDQNHFEYEIGVTQMTCRLRFATIPEDITLVVRVLGDDDFALKLNAGLTFTSKKSFADHLSEVLGQAKKKRFLDIGSKEGRMSIRTKVHKIQILGVFDFFKLAGLTPYAVQHPNAPLIYTMSLHKETTLNSLHEIDLTALLPKFIFLYSDIIDIVNGPDFSYNLMTIIPLSPNLHQDAFQTLEFPNINYAKMSRSFLQEFSFRLRSDSGQNLRPLFPKSPLYLSLSVKSRRKTGRRRKTSDL